MPAGNAEVLYGTARVGKGKKILQQEEISSCLMGVCKKRCHYDEEISLTKVSNG